jgi:polar amino acid transport system substrate-binding protein
MKQRLANLSLALILVVVSVAIAAILHRQPARPVPSGRRAVEQGWVAPGLPLGERRRLRFLLRADCPPFSYLLPAGGEPVGLDADTARALALHLGVECSLVGIPQREIAERFLRGEGDVLMAALGPGSEHDQSLDFTVPHYRSRGVLVVAGPSRDRFAEGLPDSARLCLLAGTAHSGALPQKPDGGEPIAESGDWDQLAAGLAEGRCNAVLADVLSAYHFLGSRPDQGFALLPMPVASRHPSAVCLAVRKGAGELRHSLDNALRDLQMNGSLRQIHHRYFPFDIE